MGDIPQGVGARFLPQRHMPLAEDNRTCAERRDMDGVLSGGKTAFLAIDPGTHKMGLAVFRFGGLGDWMLALAQSKDPIDVRIGDLVEGLNRMLRSNPDVTEVACERPATVRTAQRMPAPELGAFFHRIQRWARDKGLPLTSYHPSTVTASVRPRGLKGAPTKEVIKLGVRMLYGASSLLGSFEVIDQNVLDAVAVGHCHLSKLREAELLCPS